MVVSIRRPFDNSHIPMMIVDLETGIIDDVNQAACNYYKYSKDEFVLMKVQDITEGEGKEAHQKDILKGNSILH